jgi:hypothetical protein
MQITIDNTQRLNNSVQLIKRKANIIIFVRHVLFSYCHYSLIREDKKYVKKNLGAAPLDIISQKCDKIITTATADPQRQGGMAWPKTRQRSAAPHSVN